MGKRKREMAAAIKESRKSVFVAKGSYPSSPRKMRLVVDLIRGKSVEEAFIFSSSLSRKLVRS